MDNKSIDQFLSQYSDEVFSNAIRLRQLIFGNLPDVKEQLDLPAKMIAYCYGQKYNELVCVLIPSKKGLKLGFYRGIDLPDPDNLLKGTGKLSRYAEIMCAEDIRTKALTRLLKEAYKAYKIRVSK